jgi:DNA replication protein
MKKKREEFKRWQEQMRRAEEERRREARLKAAGLAARRLRDMTFRTFQKRPGTEAALDAVRRFLQGFSPHCGRGLLLVGNTGSGKTHLAAAVAHYLLEKGTGWYLRTSRTCWRRSAGPIVATTMARRKR